MNNVENPAQAALQRILHEATAPLRKRYSEIAVHLTPPVDTEVVSGTALTDADTLRATLARFSSSLGTTDERIVGVHWLGQLGYAVLPPVEMALTRAGIGLDASLNNLLIVQPNGSPAQIVLRDPTRMLVYAPRCTDLPVVGQFAQPVASVEALQEYVLERMWNGTFTPLIDALHALTGVSRKVLWGQIAYEAELFYTTLLRVDPEERTSAWEEDWAATFGREHVPALGGPNPLYRPTREAVWTDPETGETEDYDVRTVCCLIYKVSVDRMCGACPLGLKEEQVVDKLGSADARRAERAALG